MVSSLSGFSPRRRRVIAAFGNVLALTMLSTSGSSAGNWLTKSPMPAARYTHAAATLNGLIHIVGGADQSNCSALTSHDVYDPVGDTWASRTPLQIGRAHPAAAVLNNGAKDLLYVVGGATFCSLKTDTMEAYDPDTNSWTFKASMPGGARNSMGAAVIDNKLYVIGGIGLGEALTARAEVYDPISNTWSTIASLRSERYSMAIGAIDGILYAAGGGNDVPNFTVLDAYDPATNTWSSRAPLSTVRAYAASAVVNGLLYAIGGQNSLNLSSVEIYDPVTNTWGAGPTLPAARSIMPAAVVANRVYIMGGGYTPSNGLYGDTLVLTDAIAPTTTATPSVAPNGNGWNNGDVAVTLSAADDLGGSGVTSLVYSLSGAQNGGATISGSSTTFAITQEGTTTVTFHAIDAAGNVESDRSVVVKIDKTPPSVAPPNNQTLNATAGGTVATFSPSASDALSGLASVQTSPLSSGQLFPVGTTTVLITAYDAAGNSAMTSFTVTIVPSRPIVTVTGGAFVEDGSPHPATVSVQDSLGNPVSGSVGIVYMPGGGAAPSAPGTYGATATFASSDPGILSASPWTARTPDLNAKVTPAVIEIDGKLYVHGFDQDASGSQGSFVPRLSLYDPSSNTWSVKASPTLIRAYVSAAAINGKIYVVGGCLMSDCRIGTTNALEIYDVAANQWSNGPAMPTARFGAAVGAIGGRLYVAGGTMACPNCDPTNVTEIYDPATNAWTSGAPIPSPRELPMSAVVNSQLHVIGGYQRDPANPLPVVTVGTVLVYDPAANSWSTRSSMPTPRAAAAIAAIDGRIYVAGGVSVTGIVGTPLANHESYDPATDRWAAYEPMPTARYYVSGGAIGSTMYVIDGSNGAQLSANDAFDASLAASITIVGSTPPTAAFTASPNPSACGLAVQFDATASAATTPGRHIVSYAWNFGDGSMGTGATNAHGYSQFGTYTATLMVADNHTPAQTATVSHIITVNQGNQPPQVNAGGPYTVNAGSSIQLTANAADPNVSCGDHVVAYNWTIDGTIQLTGQSVLLDSTGLGSGPHNVSLQVTDTFGAIGSASTTVTVQKVLVSVSVSPSSASIAPGQNQTFQAIGHFSDGTTQTLQSGNGGGGGGVFTGPSNRAWSVQMSPPIDVNACATAQSPTLSFSSQGIIDQSGVVHTTWSPLTPVVNVDGTITESSVHLTLACTNNPATGSITATWNGTRYAGTYSFNGASSGAVSITGWSQQAPMPAARFSHAAASFGGNVYVFGGGNPSQPSPVLKYQPGSNTWNTLGNMPTSREGLGAATINGLIYVAGGHVSGGVASGVLEAYDPSNDSWTTNLAPMPTPRAHLAVVTDGTYLYALGGDTVGSNGGLVSTVERYDPATNTWLARAPMPSAGNFVVAGVLNNTIVVAGINNSTNTDVYDIAANAWHAGAAMPAARSLAAAGVASGGMYVVGGTVNGSPMYPAWVYYPATAQTPDYWSGPGSIPTARAQLAAAVVGDVVYAIGGFVPGSNPQTVVTSNEALSTPPANTFSALSSGSGNTLPTVQWQSSNPSVAGVDNSGSAHANTVGQVTITAVASTGISCAATTTCATLSVVDSVAPNLFLPPNMTVEANNPGGKNNVMFFASSFDNVAGSRQVNCTWANGGSASFFPPSFSQVTRSFPFGTTTVSCSASDPSGNTANGSFTITVRDSNPPFLNVPSQPIMADATSAAGAVVNVLGPVSAFDSVDGQVTPLCTPSSGSTFPIGSTQVSCTATDAHLNTSAPKTFTVQVNDQLTVHLPSNITAEATSPSGAAVPFAVSATYFLGGSEPVQCFIITGFVNGDPQIGPPVAPGATFPLGTTTVGSLANHPDGGHEGGFFTITVQDTTAPQITTPVNMVVNATSLVGAAVAFSVTATDLVDGVRPVTCTPASGSTFALATTTVQCSASDTRQNTGTTTFTVTVLSPQQILTNIIAAAVEAGFQSSSSLLQNILQNITSGTVGTACSQLGAFISQVQAQSGKKLTVEEAAALIQLATDARSALGC